MSFASILALIDGGPASSAVLKMAERLGRAQGSYLECLHIEPEPTLILPFLGEAAPGVAMDETLARAKALGSERAAAALRQFEEMAVADGLAVIKPDAGDDAGRFQIAWRHVQGADYEELSQRALFFDLLILPLTDESGSFLTPALDAALFASIRPVILVPKEHEDRPIGQVAIAWHGTQEATLAATLALPLLRRAEGVTLLYSEEPHHRGDVEAFRRYLARHGVKTALERLEDEKETPGGRILSAVSDVGTDLLVMGAYGHSRMREFVLGGATHTVLQEAPLPLFMAH